MKSFVCQLCCVWYNLILNFGDKTKNFQKLWICAFNLLWMFCCEKWLLSCACRVHSWREVLRYFGNGRVIKGWGLRAKSSMFFFVVCGSVWVKCFVNGMVLYQALKWLQRCPSTSQCVFFYFFTLAECCHSLIRYKLISLSGLYTRNVLQFYSLILYISQSMQICNLIQTWSTK